MKRIAISQIYLNLLSDYLDKITLAHKPEPGDVVEKEKCLEAYKSKVDQSEIENIIGEIEKETGNLAFGLKVGEHIHPSDYGTIGYAMMNFPNLHQALGFAAEHKHMLNQAFSTELKQKGSKYHYQTKNIMANHRLAPLVELDYASAIQLARFFVGAQRSKGVKLIQVNFQHEALSDAKDYQRIFDCPVHFGQATSELVISKRVLGMPIRSANPQMLQMLLRKVERWKKDMLSQASFSQKVLSYISSQKQENIPSISSVADEFSISVSTVKKRLKLEKLNYSTLCDDVKKNIALKMVANPVTQIKEIYINLNFASSSAFNRAFKRWTNMSPTEYRRSKGQDENQTNKKQDKQ